MTATDPRRIARIGLFEAYRSLDRRTWIEATGRSMDPSIPAGSRLLVDFGRRPERAGEVIVFRRHDELIAHRLVGRRRTADGIRLVAKGDGEAFLDPEIGEDDVLGVVRRVRLPDGREATVSAGSRGAAVARVSWWSGRAAGAGSRLLRRVPATPRLRGAALRCLVGMSRVPTRVVFGSPTPARPGPSGGRR